MRWFDMCSVCDREGGEQCNYRGSYVSSPDCTYCKKYDKCTQSNDMKDAVESVKEITKRKNVPFVVNFSCECYEYDKDKPGSEELQVRFERRK